VFYRAINTEQEVVVTRDAPIIGR